MTIKLSVKVRREQNAITVESASPKLERAIGLRIVARLLEAGAKHLRLSVTP